MLSCFNNSTEEKFIPIVLIEKDDFDSYIDKQYEKIKHWTRLNNFKAKPYTYCLIPDKDGDIETVLVGVKNKSDFWAVGSLPYALPEGNYKIEEDADGFYAFAWGLGAYNFDRYKKSEREPAKLYVGAKLESLSSQIESINLTRTLINTPTEDMGPEELADTVKDIAKSFKADFKQIVGEDLLKQNYPTIHAVGRGSVNPPRLIELKWGKKDAPKLTLIGKGICFDSGGYNMKSSAGIMDMKKDMGGAAHALGLARMVMASNLNVNLRLLIASAENLVSSNAYKPNDIITTRKGITVEVLNTDAEGRLVLCDALADACDEEPELIIDFATLTGAARVALGPDLPAMFCNDNDIANGILSASSNEQDPIWRMPLFNDYNDMLKSKIADIGNCVTSSPYGGAITAALYLQKFITDNQKWVHFDIMAANTKAKPGRPEGGEAQGIRAVHQFLTSRYS